MCIKLTYYTLLNVDLNKTHELGTVLKLIKNQRLMMQIEW